MQGSPVRQKWLLLHRVLLLVASDESEWLWANGLGGQDPDH
jgi:hypothetical protein